MLTWICLNRIMTRRKLIKKKKEPSVTSVPWSQNTQWRSAHTQLAGRQQPGNGLGNNNVKKGFSCSLSLLLCTVPPRSAWGHCDAGVSNTNTQWSQHVKLGQGRRPTLVFIEKNLPPDRKVNISTNFASTWILNEQSFMWSNQYRYIAHMQNHIKKKSK